jgi:hypothetical protein
MIYIIYVIYNYTCYIYERERERRREEEEGKREGGLLTRVLCDWRLL